MFNPYLLLAVTSLCWSGNHLMGRAVGGVVPPLGISALRWAIPFVLLAPFALPYLKRDWPALRKHWVAVTFLCVTGGTLFTTLQYIGLQMTSALNVSVINSLVPVLIPVSAAILFRERVSRSQFAGIALSSLGVLAIIARGEVDTLRHMSFNEGDLIILVNMAIFAVYAACLRLRPAVHEMSFLVVFSAISATTTLPFAIWEAASGFTFKPTPLTFVSILYVGIFPSVVAFFCWNKGVEAIGATRAGPFLHLIPIFTAIFGTTLLGEHLAWYHVVGFALILGGVWLASAFSPKVAAPAGQS